MRSHIQVVAVLHLILDGIAGLVGIGMFFMLGGIGLLIGVAQSSALPALPLLGGLGFFVMCLCLAISLPGILAGVGLLQNKTWGRTLAMVVGFLSLFNFPIGTALGVYTFWVMTHPETIQLFSNQPYRPIR